MQTVTLSEGDKPYTVTACVVLCGKDIAVVIGGGEASHIGAAALASPRPSLKNTAEISASASVLCRLGHKDDLPAIAILVKFVFHDHLPLFIHYLFILFIYLLYYNINYFAR